jgi:hypothetical protein
MLHVGCGTSAEVSRLLQEEETRLDGGGVQSVRVQSGSVGQMQFKRCGAQIQVKLDLHSNAYSLLRCGEGSLPVMETFRMPVDRSRLVKKVLSGISFRKFADGPLSICSEKTSGKDADQIEVVHADGETQAYVSLEAFQAARAADAQRADSPGNDANRVCQSTELVHGVFVLSDAKDLLAALQMGG